DPRAIYAVGGGTRNRAWAQATSDMSGKNQIVRQKTVGASYGDAFLAALAVGDVKAADINRWNPVASVIAAEPSDAYRRQYGIYREIYARTKDLMREVEE
ncbi:MAG TPA: carbohydrate kinase, partial [Propylenella sp.]